MRLSYRYNQLDQITREWQILELLAFWGGGTTAEEYARVLNVRREAAQHKVKAFRTRHPDALTYDRSARRLRFTAHPDVLRYSPNEPDRLLNWLLGEQIAAAARGEASPLPLPLVDVSALVPHPALPEALRAIITSIGRRCTMQVRYVSRQRVSWIEFSPHTVVWAAGRHHVRGYGISSPYTDGRWIDLVLARMVIVEDGNDLAYVSGDQDADWYTEQDVTFRFVPDLPERDRDALRQDYGLSSGDDLLVVPNVRRALNQYVIREVEGRRIEGRAAPVWEEAVLS